MKRRHQIAHHRGDRGVAVGGIQCGSLAQNRFETPQFVTLAAEHDARIGHSRQQFAWSPAAERTAAEDDFSGHDTDGEYIDTVVDFGSAELFGRHVAGRSHYDARIGQAGGLVDGRAYFRKAEVENF